MEPSLTVESLKTLLGNITTSGSEERKEEIKEERKACGFKKLYEDSRLRIFGESLEQELYVLAKDVAVVTGCPIATMKKYCLEQKIKKVKGSELSRAVRTTPHVGQSDKPAKGVQYEPVKMKKREYANKEVYVLSERELFRFLIKYADKYPNILQYRIWFENKLLELRINKETHLEANELPDEKILIAKLEKSVDDWNKMRASLKKQGLDPEQKKKFIASEIDYERECELAEQLGDRERTDAIYAAFFKRAERLEKDRMVSKFNKHYEVDNE